jgi:uncharacterized protein YndB with AHSA1/START domain
MISLTPGEAMIDDVARHLGSVSREVKDRIHEGKPAKVVVISRVFDTTVDDAWDAITNQERIPRWFAPVTGDLKLGGRFQVQGNAGGTITTCEPPRRFDATWEFGGGVSWITLTVSPEPGEKARVQLEHIAHPEAHWEQFGPGAVGAGWDMAFLGLTLHLTPGRPAIDPKEGMAWMGTAQGKEFIAISAKDWGRADIALGTDEAVALASAERTRAAYTGESPTG